MGMFWIVSVLCAAACSTESGEEGPGGAPGNVLDDLSVPPTITAIEYATSLQFLPLGTDATRAIVLQFANTATSSGLSHRYQGWLLNRSNWRAVLDAEFTSPPVRAPWRLFPADSLRLTVTDDGDSDDIILTVGAVDYTLDLGTHLDGWEDRAGTWHEIREAVWSSRGARLNGVAVGHRFAVPEPQRATRFGTYERVILRSEDGAIIVLFHARNPELYGDSFAWMYADGLTRRWTELEARTVEVANSAQLRRNVPVRFWFRIPEPDIKCELTAAERQFNELTVEEGPKPYNALYRVRGWIEFAGERRNVEGLLERGET
jgi:hypothetical protein